MSNNGLGKPAPFVFWSNSGNFPAGPDPWATTPVAAQPAGTFFTPNTRIAAENANYLFGNLSVDGQALQDYVGNEPAMNWKNEGITKNMVTGVAGEQVTSACWAPLSNMWVTVAFETATGDLFAFYSKGLDGDQNWTKNTNNISGTQPTFSACCEDPLTVGKLWVVNVNATPSLNVLESTNNAVYGAGFSAWTNKRTDATAGRKNLQMATLNSGAVVYAVLTQIAGTGNSTLTLSTTTNGGTSWTDTVETHISAGTTAVPVVLFLKSNGTLLVAGVMGEGVFASADFYIFTSSDGLTWTSQPLGFTTTGTTVLGGIAWGQDASGPCWFLQTYDTGTNLTKIYRSPNAANWVLVATIATQKELGDLEANGSLLVSVDNISNSGIAAFTAWSPDGGKTWYPGQASLSTNNSTGTVGYVPGVIRSSPIGFLLFNNLRMRFSTLAGLPAVAL